MSDPPTSQSSHLWPSVGRALLVLVIVIGVGVAFLYRDALTHESIRGLFESLGPWRVLGFLVVYVMVALFFLPASLLTIAAGALFGPYWGALWSVFGATLGGVAAFLVSRYTIGHWLRARLSGRFEQIASGVESQGWRFVLLTRLIPLFPYNVLNYALGTTRIGLGQFALASFIGMAPGAVVYTYLGHAGATLASGEQGAYQAVLVALALLAVLVFVVRFIRQRHSMTES